MFRRRSVRTNCSLEQRAMGLYTTDEMVASDALTTSLTIRITTVLELRTSLEINLLIIVQRRGLLAAGAACFIKA